MSTMVYDKKKDKDDSIEDTSNFVIMLISLNLSFD